MTSFYRRSLRLPLCCLVPLLTTVLSRQPVQAESWWSSFTGSSDWNSNGHRTMSRFKDGIKRRIEGDVDFEVHDGQITKLKEGAVLKLEQSGGPQQRQAELRGTSEAPALWIKDDKGFHVGTEPDQQWLRGFLDAFEMKPAEGPAEATPSPTAAGLSGGDEAKLKQQLALAKDGPNDDTILEAATHIQFSVSRNSALESVVSSALTAKNFKLATRAADLIDFGPTKDAQLQRVVEAMAKEQQQTSKSSATSPATPSRQP